MTDNSDWITLHYRNCILRKDLPRIEIDEYPLKPITSSGRILTHKSGSLPSTGRTTPVQTPPSLLNISAILDGIDPLTRLANEELDPLSQFAAEVRNTDVRDMIQTRSKKEKASNSYNTAGNKLLIGNIWDARKRAILEHFTTSEKLTIVTSFLSDGEKILVKQSSNASVDQVQHRLEQLDYFEESSQRTYDVSQTEYCMKIEQLRSELVLAWRTEQRVKALKIAIQCSKLLSDTDVIHFYPSKFVLITEILDSFGQLIFDRLRTKDSIESRGKPPTILPEDFTPDMVPEATKETCRNWFYKIASIRELVPRIYVEMAILKSYSFLTSSEYSGALLRLTHMIRGIGNPLVAAYARCYLSRVGLSVTGAGPAHRYLMENFYDFMAIYPHVYNTTVVNSVLHQSIDNAQYLSLYCPALEFILEVAAVNSNDQLLSEVLEKCSRLKNNLLVLHTILMAFQPMLLAVRALQIADMIGLSDLTSDQFPVHRVLCRLGYCVSGSDATLSAITTPPEHQRQILNIVWKFLDKFSNPANYISCVNAWIEFIVKQFQSREINIILDDVIKRMKPSRIYENHYGDLRCILDKIVTYTQDFEGLLAMESFLPFMDLFQTGTTRTDACKRVISAYLAQLTSPQSSTAQQITNLFSAPFEFEIDRVTDPVIVNTLTHLCTVLHDALSVPLAVEDERRQVGDLIAAIVRRVDFGVGERQLNYYVDARAAFSNLDMVLAQLVQSVNTLSVKAREAVQGNHTRKSGAFVRACAAYCFITIPSISSVKTRLELYLLSGHVALYNHCLGQADASFKAALLLLSDLSSNYDENCHKTEQFMLMYVRNMLSILLVVPDSPDRGVLSLTRALINILQRFSWQSGETTLAMLYLNIIDVIYTMGHDNYPYHIDKVESNDTLYGSDPKFLIELDKITSVVISELILQLKVIHDIKTKAYISLQLIIRLLSRCELNTKVTILTEDLWNTMVKNGPLDMKSDGIQRLRNILKSSRSEERLKERILKLVS